MKCTFCDIVIRNEPASIIFEDDSILAFMSIQPSQPGECMVIPKRHIDHFTDVPDDLAAHLLVTAQRIGRKMMKVLSPKRVGMVVHGFGIPHAHLILVPQHKTDDITSGRFARLEGGNIVFDLKQITVANREELDRQATLLRIHDEPNNSPDPAFASGASRAGHEPRHR
jgi:histidine triad (HIT) family protein